MDYVSGRLVEYCAIEGVENVLTLRVNHASSAAKSQEKYFDGASKNDEIFV